MDTRYTDLRAVCAYEGLSDEERRHGLDLLDGAPVTVAYAYTCLLRGALAERFNLLANPAMAKQRGLKEGAALVVKLLSDHQGQALTNDDVTRGVLAVGKPGQTCNGLLALYLRTRRYLDTRRPQAA